MFKQWLGLHLHCMQHQKLVKAAAIMLIVVLTVIILKYGKPFLVPLAFGAMLAMLLVPICDRLEKKKVNKVLATILSILVLVAFFAGVIAFIGWQVSDLAEDASKMEQQVKEKYSEIRQYISRELRIPEEKQEDLIKKQQQSSGGGQNIATAILSGLGSFLTNTLLVLVYIFLLLYFRQHLERFVVHIVSNEDKAKAVDAVNRIQEVTQKYLSGMAQMIVGLWIMYGIGFSIVGVKNAIFFAVLCGMLEIVPFVGNLVGNALTILMAISQGGGTNMIIGILITYGLIQFTQSYILEPLVVGAEVNINPLFTILGLVAGELVWGIPGMILAIPLMGITKIIFDHVEALKPYGELIGVEKKGKNKLKNKFEDAAKRLVKRFKK
jgi:predicted PurR-regulated permease PerM